MKALAAVPVRAPLLPLPPAISYQEVRVELVAFDPELHEHALDRSQEDDPHDLVMRSVDIEHLRSLLPTLPQREQSILHLRYGLADSVPHTWDEVAQKVGFSEKWVRVIHDQTLERLRLLWDSSPTVNQGRPDSSGQRLAA